MRRCEREGESTINSYFKWIEVSSGRPLSAVRDWKRSATLRGRDCISQGLIETIWLTLSSPTPPQERGTGSQNSSY